MNKSLKLLLTGVAIGILIAPAKGSATRKKLADGIRDLKDGISDEINELSDSGQRIMEQGRAKMNSVLNSLDSMAEPI